MSYPKANFTHLGAPLDRAKHDLFHRRFRIGEKYASYQTPNLLASKSFWIPTMHFSDDIFPWRRCAIRG
jgi:hypothetical protein